MWLQGFDGRTSHGVRGLKLWHNARTKSGHQSHLSRGAWIEINELELKKIENAGRTSHGVRGLKFQLADSLHRLGGRTSHGVRGLKFDF